MKTTKYFEDTLPVYSASNFLQDATDPVTFPMTNDYLFRAMLQRNNKVLKGLISSLLHMPDNEIISVKEMTIPRLNQSFKLVFSTLLFFLNIPNSMLHIK